MSKEKLAELYKVRNTLSVSFKVALYVRVSSKEQVEGYSIGEQEERLRDYCKAMGWDIFKIYIDPGYTGSNTDRPGLQTMIKDIEDGVIDKVVVYKLDRLSRSQLDTLYLIEKVFLANGADFVSMTENFDTSSPFGRAMIGILAVFAQLERDRINERTLMGKEARAKEGKWGGGSSEPIGYDYNIADDTLYINEYEALQIREAIDLFLRGTPLRTICTIFHNKGYTYTGRSGKTSEWEPKRLKYVFSNRLYLGYIKYRGEWYPSNHTPIMDEETYDKLQVLLKQRKEKYKDHNPMKTGQTTYLGGLLYCKHCGGRYCRQAGKKSKSKPAPLYYSCYSRNKSVPKMIKDPNCKNKNWRMGELDEGVFNEIRKLAVDPEYINNAKAERDKNSDKPNKIAVLKKEITSLDDQISRFMDLYGIGKFTIDQVSSKVDPLNDRRLGLEKELEALNAHTGELSVVEALRVAQSFDEVLDSGDFDKIRLAIETLIYYIELDDDVVEIHWRFL